MLDDNANASALLANNLEQCLLCEADRWYTSELSETSRAVLHTNVDLWSQDSEGRFKEAQGVALSRLEALRCTDAGVQARKEPEEYVQQIIVNGKNAGTATTEAARVTTAYNHLDVQLRVLLP